MYRIWLSWILSLYCLTHSIGMAAETLVVDLGDGVSIELVRVSKGQFSQGSPESEQGREADEVVRTVVLSNDFYLGTTPVTVGQFRRFVAATNYRTEAESGPSGGFGVVGGELVQQPQFNWKNPGYAQTDEHPVTIVTFADATSFLKWLSEKSARTMVLPTEAQWEYACRAGSTSRFSNGDDDAAMDAIGWSQKNAASAPMPVKQKQPNAFGLCDMSGNVYEWCQDVYNLHPPDSVSDPLQVQGQPGEKVRNVLRGGSWMRLPKRCRSAARYRATPGTRNAENGFRVATMDLQVVAVSPKVDTPPQAAENGTSPMPEPSPETDSQHSTRFVNEPPPGSPESPWSGVGSFFFALFVGLITWFGRKFFSKAFAPDEPETLVKNLRERANLPDRIDGVALGMMSGLFQTEEDGFWFSTESYAIGTMLQCEYWADKTLFNETVEVTSPVRQFFYTGSPPTDIKIRIAEYVSRPGDRNSPYPTETWNSETEPSPPRNNPQTYVFVDPLNPAYSRSEHGHDETPPEPPAIRGAGFPPAY